jgi:hypothetical protein
VSTRDAARPRVSRDHTRRERRWCVMRLKAIASPGERRRSSRWRSAQPRNERRPARPRDGSVLDAVRLRAQSPCGAALEGAYLLEDRAATRSFSCLGQEAVPGSAAEPGESGTAGSGGNASQAAARRPNVNGRADVDGPSAAKPCGENGDAVAQLESWPAVGPLATEVGICGQIDGNPLVIQGDLATNGRAEIVRNPCSDAVMRGCCPVPW